MNSIHKLILIAILSILSYSYADDYKDKGKADALAKVNAEETIIISEPVLKNSVFILAAKLVLKEAYSRIGKEMKLERYPLVRSMIFANDGITDGELVRIAGLQKNSLT